MRPFYLLLLLLCASSLSIAQTSIANGNWTSPFTWNCTCVPLPGATVTIDHAVVLNTDWITNSGSITINSGGSLIQDGTGHDIQIAGGFITNNGTLDLRYIYNQAGTMTNNGNMAVASFLNMDVFDNTGTVTGVDSIYTDGTLTNSGSLEVFTFYNADQLSNTGMIHNVDSMSNVGFLVNASGAEIYADSASNAGTFMNYGSCFHSAMTNSGTFTNHNYIALNDFTNWGTFNNNDSIVATGSMTNAGAFTNNQSATVTLDVSFLNANIISNNASFENNGFLGVGDSWYNFDLFFGNTNGRVEVQDTSANMGVMNGDFDFCDYSPNTILPPQPPAGIDYNSGTVSGSITWCLLTGMDIDEEIQLSIFPNPADEHLYIEGVTPQTQTTLCDLKGKRILDVSGKHRVDVSSLPDGVYLLRLQNEQRTYHQKIVVQHK